jgi:hypothetical protein
MKYEILNRYSNAVMLTAEIDCDESTPESIKMRKAVEWAIKNNESLAKAYLHGADLRDADLGINIPVIPNNIHQKVYEAASKPNALKMNRWHSCDTTHCRAGWVVTLAGEDGKALEEKLGTSAAAALIYFKSDPTLEKTPNFYCDNAEALADMKALAEKEAQQ